MLKDVRVDSETFALNSNKTLDELSTSSFLQTPSELIFLDIK